MIKIDGEGPQIYNIPQHQQTVCNGCRFLDRQAGMRGHKTVTEKDNTRSVMGVKGKMIAYAQEYPCPTPSWCPFKKQNNG